MSSDSSAIQLHWHRTIVSIFSHLSVWQCAREKPSGERRKILLFTILRGTHGYAHTLFTATKINVHRIRCCVRFVCGIFFSPVLCLCLSSFILLVLCNAPVQKYHAQYRVCFTHSLLSVVSTPNTRKKTLRGNYGCNHTQPSFLLLLALFIPEMLSVACRCIHLFTHTHHTTHACTSILLVVCT